jgi:hypothetical protein
MGNFKKCRNVTTQSFIGHCEAVVGARMFRGNGRVLFFANSSRFGVVTAITVKVYPTFPVVVTRFFVNSTKPGAIMDATALFLQEGGKLRDKNGLQGYFYVYPGSFQSAMHFGDEFATLANAKIATEYIMKKLENIAGANRIEPKYYEYKTYKDWYIGEYGDEMMEEKGEKFLSWWDGSDGPVPSEAEAMFNPFSTLPWAVEYPQMAKRSEGMSVMRSQASTRHYLDSRLLSDQHVNSVSIKTLAAAIKDTMPDIPGIHIRGFLYGGGKQWQPDKDAMGLLPAWRNATYHFIVSFTLCVTRTIWITLPPDEFSPRPYTP